MTVLDVGAHVGWFALQAARLVGPRGKVIAVEADPRNAALLRLNAERLGVANVEVLHAAALEAPGAVELALCATNTGDHRVGLAGEGRPTVAVPGVRLDDVLGGRARVDVVLLDTQGSEQRVLAGLRATIERCRPQVLAEHWPEGIRSLGGDPDAAVAAYRALGYRIAVVGADLPGGATPAEVTALAEREHGGFCTLALSPVERPPRRPADGPLTVAPAGAPGVERADYVWLAAPGDLAPGAVARAQEVLAAHPGVAGMTVAPGAATRVLARPGEALAALEASGFARAAQVCHVPSLDEALRLAGRRERRGPAAHHALVARMLAANPRWLWCGEDLLAHQT